MRIPPQKKRRPKLADRAAKAAESDHGTPLVLTVDEAAARLRISRVHLYRLLGDNRIKSVVFGRCRRIVAASLDEFVAQLAGGGAAAE